MAYPPAVFNAFASTAPVNARPAGWLLPGGNLGKNQRGPMMNSFRGPAINHMPFPMRGPGRVPIANAFRAPTNNQMHVPMVDHSNDGFEEFVAFANSIGLPEDELNDWEQDLREQLLSILDHLEARWNLPCLPLMDWINFRIGGEVESFVDASGATFIRRRVDTSIPNERSQRKPSRSRSKRARGPQGHQRGNSRQAHSPKRQTNSFAFSGKVPDPSAAVAEEGDPVYERENEEPKPWPQMENSDGTFSDAHNAGEGYFLHFRHPDKPMCELHELDLRRVADYLRSSHGFEYANIQQTSSGIAQINFIGKRTGCIQLYLTKVGCDKGNIKICTGDQERLKYLRSVLLKSAWFTDASNPMIPAGSAGQNSTVNDSKKEKKLNDLEFDKEDVELTQRHLQWLKKLPEGQLSPGELNLRTALFQFVARWEGDSLATLGDLLADRNILRNMHFMPKRFPLEAWVDRRVGAEMFFEDGDGTRLGMCCQVTESNEELVVPTVTP